MMLKNTLAAAAAALLLSAPIVDAQAASTTQAEALAACLNKAASQTDKDSLVQWAYVTLGKTSAAKKVQTISDAKTTQVERTAQTTLSKLVLTSCPKEAMQVLLKDPKNGLQDTLASLTRMEVEERISKSTSPLLSLTITDLMKR